VPLTFEHKKFFGCSPVLTKNWDIYAIYDSIVMCILMGISTDACGKTITAEIVVITYSTLNSKLLGDISLTVRAAEVGFLSSCGEKASLLLH
jgi:hypothetical protein